LPDSLPISILESCLGTAVSHISDDDLELLTLDRLPESAAVPAEVHLLTCAECRERLAGWDEYVAGMRGAMAINSDAFRNYEAPSLIDRDGVILCDMLYGILEPGQRGIVRVECEARDLQSELERRGAKLEFAAANEEEFQAKKRQYDEQFKPEWR
jgi:hypothetical protein